mgnify:CR=1 FL=1
MDRPEIVANKGYKSIADLLIEEGEAAGCKKMQPLLDAEKARADRERERAERAEALLRKYGCLI